MGFFKDLNDEAVEATDELIEETESTADDGLVTISAEGDASELVMDGESESVDESLLQNLFDDEQLPEETEADEEYIIESTPARPVAAADAEEQVTVITKGTTINGSIVSDCSLNVMGTINGDIECIGKLSISGSVSGNSIASDVYVNAKRLDGNIDSEGAVKIGLGTVVVGDVKAGSAVIAGAIKGELDIKGPVVLDSTAIIKGNIKAKSVQMNNGAVLEGFCSLSYASVDIDDIFE